MQGELAQLQQEREFALDCALARSRYELSLLEPIDSDELGKLHHFILLTTRSYVEVAAIIDNRKDIFACCAGGTINDVGSVFVISLSKVGNDSHIIFSYEYMMLNAGMMPSTLSKEKRKLGDSMKNYFSISLIFF